MIDKIEVGKKYKYGLDIIKVLSVGKEKVFYGYIEKEYEHEFTQYINHALKNWEEIDEENIELHQTIAKQWTEIQKLKTENSILMKVVEFYGEGNSHYNEKYEWGENHSKTCGTETRPSGEKACQALEKIKGIRGEK